jgi:hypothetical protein
MLKNKNLNENELCIKWLANKTINPETTRKIKENGPVYNKLLKKCSLNQNKNLNEKELCNKWLANKTINPATLRKIKENGSVYKKLSKKCLVKPKSEVKLNSEERKIAAIKKIHKLFIPYVKRTSVNIIDRINYFIIMKKYLLSIKEKNNCLRLYNIDETTKLPIYRIGKRIILDKQIGTKSAYGIVYLSHFKSNVRYGTKFDRLNKFAVKITNQTKNNFNEVKVLEDLTKQVIGLKCPHFPISFGSLLCNSTIKSDNPDDYSIVKDKHNKKKYFPDLVNSNKSLVIQINELAAGDLHSLIIGALKYDIYNIMVQIFIAIMFFHDCTKSYHGDPHSGNFLYHKIKPGGYFHYNIYGKDYYLENQGYLWVIWDFGLINPFEDKNKYGKKPSKVSINYDYNYILNALNYYNYKLTSNAYYMKKGLYDNVLKYNAITDYNKLNDLNKEILNYLLLNVSSFTTIKPSNIINKTAYIIR